MKRHFRKCLQLDGGEVAKAVIEKATLLLIARLCLRSHGDIFFKTTFYPNLFIDLFWLKYTNADHLCHDHQPAGDLRSSAGREDASWTSPAPPVRHFTASKPTNNKDMLRISVRWMVAVLPILVVGGSLFFCEYLIYFPAILECAWPKLSHARGGEDPTPVRAMVLSDTHLLGAVGGHWFDKLRRYLSLSPRLLSSMHPSPSLPLFFFLASSVTHRWLQPECGCKQNMTTNRADPLCPHAQGMADGEGFPDRAVAAQARNSIHPGGHLRRRQVELPEGEVLSSSVQFLVVLMMPMVREQCADSEQRPAAVLLPLSSSSLLFWEKQHLLQPPASFTHSSMHPSSGLET